MGQLANLNLSLWRVQYLFGLRMNDVTNVGKEEKQTQSYTLGLRSWIFWNMQPVECLYQDLVIQIFCDIFSWYPWSRRSRGPSQRNHICDTFLSHLSANLFIQGWDHMLTCICTRHYVQADQKLMEQKCPWKLKRCLWNCKCGAKNRPLLNWSTLSAFHPVNM